MATEPMWHDPASALQALHLTTRQDLRHDRNLQRQMAKGECSYIGLPPNTTLLQFPVLFATTATSTINDTKVVSLQEEFQERSTVSPRVPSTKQAVGTAGRAFPSFPPEVRALFDSTSCLVAMQPPEQRNQEAPRVALAFLPSHYYNESNSRTMTPESTLSLTEIFGPLAARQEVRAQLPLTTSPPRTTAFAIVPIPTSRLTVAVLPLHHHHHHHGKESSETLSSQSVIAQAPRLAVAHHDASAAATATAFAYLPAHYFDETLSTTNSEMLIDGFPI